MLEAWLEEWYNNLGDAAYSRRELLQYGTRLGIGGLVGAGAGIHLFGDRVDESTRRERCHAQPGEYMYINAGEGSSDCLYVGAEVFDDE